MEHAPIFAALLGALAGALEGFVLAVLVAPYQQRRGVKSAPAIPAHLLCGSFSGGITAGIAGLWLPFRMAVGAGAAAWPLVFAILWLVTQTASGRRA
ncbi:hypothetical protein [Polyangium mundeleinium]|uniref:Major facilitator superfamily (MFS) profile domain-containing protein n=1 Tax=Polyangium mundeleinium TaxID=2995306 RepID=A0ABT5EZ99_9BACT|nr:hypothetical protein [Polyangium mundeleinium]MDC0747167.1 hypothetical protein [Polyangium mundeleinium]